MTKIRVSWEKYCVSIVGLYSNALDDGGLWRDIGLCSGVRAQENTIQNAPEEEKLKSLDDEEMLSTIENWWYVYKNKSLILQKTEAMHIKIMNRIINLAGIEYKLDE